MSSDLLPEFRFDSSDFVLRTQQQIAKDFAQHGFVLGAEFVTVPFPVEHLTEIVRNTLSEIVERHASKWMPLMYTLDISEHSYRHFFTRASTDWLPEFTWIVIRREAQKVFLRDKFRNW